MTDSCFTPLHLSLLFCSITYGQNWLLTLPSINALLCLYGFLHVSFYAWDDLNHLTFIIHLNTFSFNLYLTYFFFCRKALWSQFLCGCFTPIFVIGCTKRTCAHTHTYLYIALQKAFTWEEDEKPEYILGDVNAKFAFYSGIIGWKEHPFSI